MNRRDYQVPQFDMRRSQRRSQGVHVNTLRPRHSLARMVRFRHGRSSKPRLAHH